MWGNALGWTISLLIVAAVALGLAYAEQFDQPTAATALSRDQSLLAKIEAPAELESLLPELSGPEGFGAERARRAVEAYRADFLTYDRIARGDMPRNFAELPAIAPLIEAVMSPDAELLLPMSADVATFRPVRPPLDAIRTLGACLIQAGLYNEQRDPSASVGYYNAALSLGAKMFRERLVHSELTGGMALMSEAALRLSKMAKDPARREALATFETKLRSLANGRLVPVWEVLGTIDDTVLARHAGDAFAFARDAKDRVWRVEAAFTLGRLQFRAPRRRDMIVARRVLERMGEEDADPIVRDAARASRSMTPADYRMLR